MNEEEEFEFRLRLEKESGIQDASLSKAEPSLMDKADSYLTSFREGAIALPKGAFQLGANVGDKLSSRLYEDQFGGNIQLTPGAIETAEEHGMKLPERTPVGGQFGDSVNQAIKEQHQAKLAKMGKIGREGFDWIELGGMVSSPTSLVQTGLTKAPAVGGELVKKALLTKMLEGGKTGAVYGAGMPVVDGGDSFAEDKAIQAGLGLGIGGAIPAVTATAGVTGHYLNELRKPFTKKGITSDVEKFVRENLSSGKDKIVNAMANAKKGQTSAQAVAQGNRAAKAAGRTESFGDQIAATERALSKKTYGGDELKTIYDKQQTGRENIIDAIAGTDTKYKAAEAVRSANAKTNYAEAFNQQIRADLDLVKIAKNPYFKKAIKTANDVIGARGKKPKDNLVEYLHLVKKGIDKQLNKVGDEALGDVERAESMKVKSQLSKWLSGKTGGSYEKARTEFAKDSVTLNRMDTGKILKEQMVNPSEVESVAPFLRAVSDAPKTLKKATGFKGYDKIDDVLSAEQTSGVKRVADELLNEVKRNKMAQRGESMMNQLSGEVEFQLPHILSRPIVVANTVLAKIGRDKTPEYRKVLSDIMKNPKELERILTTPDDSVKYKIAKDIFNQITKAAPLSAAKQAGE